MSNLELGVIGNSRIGALIDTRASVVWMCVPRFDGDPVFCALLDDDSDQGRFDLELQDCVSITQAYERNTAIVRTEMADSRGARLEIVDFAPRFYQHGRMFAPVSIVRIVHRLAGRPRIRVRFAPRCEYGAAMPATTFGSHHIRADVPAYPLRLTTDAPITHVIESSSLLVEGTLTFILGPDETLAASPHETGRHMYEETAHYWRRWVRNLAVPFEWQEEVIRAAITLKLNTFDDTGGIIAALTTSVPEAPHTQRTWDYRYCWLRDAYFVINALNRLGATDSLERYLHYIENIVAEAQEGSLQPVYALNGAAELGETTADALSGYRRMGPVRVGNLAFIQAQNDVYGSAILGVAHSFFDSRLERAGDIELFRQLEVLGEQAFARHALADASLWEYRGRQEVHTFSALMCWAGCDRLVRIAKRLKLAERAEFWAQRAQIIHARICADAWNDRARQLCRNVRRQRARRKPAGDDGARFSSCVGPADCMAPWPLSSRICAEVIFCFATIGPMTSVLLKPRSLSALSGGSSHSRCWASASGHAPSSRRCSPAAIASVCSPKILMSTPANCGEIFRRLTAWSASSCVRSG